MSGYLSRQASGRSFPVFPARTLRTFLQSSIFRMRSTLMKPFRIRLELRSLAPVTSDLKWPNACRRSGKPFIYTNASRMSCPEWMPIWRRLSNMNSSGSASGFPLALMCWPWPASKATSPVSKRQVDWESIRRRWYCWTLELYRM